jgi:hypothetical protein
MRTSHQATTVRPIKKPFASAILLWVRNDQPRQSGMDYWAGPHSKIITAIPGFEEYRQIHLADDNPGLWPETPGIETAIPADRKIDGIADGTLSSLLSLVTSRKGTQVAFKDEITVFRRTLLYAGPPYTTLWYPVAQPGEKAGAHALLFLRRRDGIRTGAFRKSVKALAQAFVGTGALRELRTQVFMPWNQGLWNTPNVAHDNPVDQQFHASMILGFSDAAARHAFFASPEVAKLSAGLASDVSAIHAYVAEARTYVRNGEILPSVER